MSCASRSQLTSEAALHPARITNALAKIQYILGCILNPFMWDPLDPCRFHFYNQIQSKTRGPVGKPPKTTEQRSEHSILIDEPRDTEGATMIQ